MQRRDFLRSAMALGGALAAGQSCAFAAQARDQHVKRVLVMYKCHFDAGFIDTQAAVVRKYFTEYFPPAILLAGKMRETGSCGYAWLTGSWLLYEYLEQASAGDRRVMEHAIARGDIAWHALPFSWQT